MKPVVVYGPGRAGTRVAQRLRSEGFPLAIAGRDREKVENFARALGVAAHVATVEQVAGIDASAIVNCAGPFADTAMPIARACAGATIDYLDISGERASMPASTNALVLSGCGAKGALGAQARGLLGASGHVDIAYAHSGDGYWRPTPGALRSFAREVAALLDPRNPEYGRPPREFDFPPPFRAGLAVQASGPDDAANVHSWVSVDPGDNAIWAASHSPALVANFRAGIFAMWRTIAAASPAQLALLPAVDGALAVVAESDGERVGLSVENAYDATAALVVAALRDRRRPVLREGVRVFRGGRNR